VNLIQNYPGINLPNGKCEGAAGALPLTHYQLKIGHKKIRGRDDFYWLPARGKSKFRQD